MSVVEIRTLQYLFAVIILHFGIVHNIYTTCHPLDFCHNSRWPPKFRYQTCATTILLAISTAILDCEKDKPSEWKVVIQPKFHLPVNKHCTVFQKYEFLLVHYDFPYQKHVIKFNLNHIKEIRNNTRQENILYKDGNSLLLGGKNDQITSVRFRSAARRI